MSDPSRALNDLQGDAISGLFALWRAEAEYDFEAMRDASNSQFELTERLCSPSHFKSLSKAVETAIKDMLAKARKLPATARAIELAEAEASALFDTLAQQVSPAIVDPQNRYATCHTESYPTKAIGEARKRAMAAVEEWRLTERTVISNPPRTALNPTEAAPKRRRVPSGKLSGWLEALGSKVDEMSQLEIWRAAGTAFPENKVTRDQIRALTPNRKRGVKPTGN